MIEMHDIFFFTDIHGNGQLYDAIMAYCKKLDPEAMIVFGGDAIDRGPDGYRIMKELLNNPHVLYLKGNHEDIFCRAAREIKQFFNFDGADKERIHKVLNACKYFDYKYEAIQNSLYNGGLETLTDWVMDSMPMDLIKKAEELPLTFSYENIDICHAGGVYKTFQAAAEAEYYDYEMDPYIHDSIIWNRTGLNLGWAPNRIAIFGHTPIQFLPEYTDVKFPQDMKVQPVMYESTTIPELSGKKLDMDVCTIASNRAYVINILTMIAKGFELENDEVKEIECIQF